MPLTNGQKEAIGKYALHFKRDMNQEAFPKAMHERKERLTFFQQELKKRVDEFSEAEFDTVINFLWASRMWLNKIYLAQKIRNVNGLEKLKEQLKNLVSTSDPEQAYSRF